jgi:hypothetical protein
MVDSVELSSERGVNYGWDFAKLGLMSESWTVVLPRTGIPSGKEESCSKPRCSVSSPILEISSSTCLLFRNSSENPVTITTSSTKKKPTAIPAIAPADKPDLLETADVEP